MKLINNYISEKLIINKDTSVPDRAPESLEELKTKYELDYTRVSNCDRRYEMSDKLNKKFLAFMGQPRLEVDNMLIKFIKDNNLFDTNKYNFEVIISGDPKDHSTYYYIIIYNNDEAQTVAQMIYRYGEEIRIYTQSYSYMKMFNSIFAQIIDYILQYEKS
jgi:hypothetical protein